MASLPLLFSLLFFLSPSPTYPFPDKALPTTSGFLPVSPNSASSLYYAFYEAQSPTTPPEDTPLLIWLQGGPGCSSMIGNFFELGPYLVHSDGDSPNPSLTPNPYSWNRLFGLLFIDNPVGTGFSVASSPAEIPRNQTTVAEHLWSALQALLSSDPLLRLRPLYLTGESYAGKYVPAFGFYILKHNPRVPPSRRINLQGIAVGNGLTHPPTQVATHAATAYFSGLINQRQRRHLEELQQEAVSLTEGKQWANATDARNRVLRWLQNATGLATLYDLRRKTPYETGKVGALLNTAESRAAMGVGEGVVWEECSDAVGERLHEDVMKSTKHMVGTLLRGGRRVLLYQGQFDLRDGVVSSEAWMKEIGWDGVGGFLAAERDVWRVEGELAGYVQRYQGLTHVVVGGAGHLVPADQGRSSQVMIEGWVLQDGFFGGKRQVRALRG